MPGNLASNFIKGKFTHFILKNDVAKIRDISKQKPVAQRNNLESFILYAYLNGTGFNQGRVCQFI